MKMSITKKLAVFLNLIKESLHYLKPEDNRVILSEVKILKQGFDKQDIKDCLKYLSDNDIAQSEVAYAPEVTTSKKGVAYATHTSTRTREYNQVDYILHINRKKIKALIIEAQKFPTETNPQGKYNSRLIEKDARGDYFYDGKRIGVNKEPIYYKTFDILFSDADQDGFLSYANIEKQLVKKEVSPAQSDAIRNKRINNVLINEQDGFFRFAKVNGKRLQNKTLDGRKLIKVMRGKGVQLNNPRV